jgi:hypothetical protein
MEKHRFAVWCMVGACLFLGAVLTVPALEKETTKQKTRQGNQGDFPALPDNPLKRIPLFQSNPKIDSRNQIGYIAPRIDYKIFRVQPDTKIDFRIQRLYCDPGIDYKILRVQRAGNLNLKSLDTSGRYYGK